MIAIAEIGIPSFELWKVDWVGKGSSTPSHPHDNVGNWLWDDGGCILWDDGSVMALGGDGGEPSIHIKGSFVQWAPQKERYVWINGEQYVLDEEFELILYNTVWGYGKDISTRNVGRFSLYLEKITYFHSSGSSDYSYLFYDCKYLKDISGLRFFDTKGVINLQGFFWNNIFTDISALRNWDVSECVNLGNIFDRCAKIEDFSPIKDWETRKNTSLNYMCANNNSVAEITSFANWDVSKVTNFTGIFWGARMSKFTMNDWDFGSATSFKNIFYDCGILTDITGSCKNIKLNLDLSLCPLSPESAMVFINGLAEITTKQTLTLRSSTYNSLTDEQKAVATAKGWSIVSA